MQGFDRPRVHVLDARPPLPHADIVTGTTTKTLRGPRGGLILSRSTRFAKALQSAVFPGVQDSLHPNVLAAKAVCLGEALGAEFKAYAAQVFAHMIRVPIRTVERWEQGRSSPPNRPRPSSSWRRSTRTRSTAWRPCNPPARG